MTRVATLVILILPLLFVITFRHRISCLIHDRSQGGLWLYMQRWKMRIVMLVVAVVETFSV